MLSKISEKHTIALYNESGSWKITEDLFDTELGKSSEITQQDLTLMEDKLIKTKVNVNNRIEKAKQSPPTKLEIVKTPAKKSKKSIQKFSIMSTTYDKLAATNYAETYAISPNTAYKDMSANGGGGDCTNFVSQCVRAGGGNNDTTGSYTWWYNNQGTSSTTDDTWVWTWASAYGFNYAVRGNYTMSEYGPKGYAISIVGDSNYDNSWGQYLVNGDIIQYASGDADSTIYHSAIITTLMWNSSKNRWEPLISQHTSNAADIPWNKGAYKTYFMFMTGVN